MQLPQFILAAVAHFQKIDALISKIEAASTEAKASAEALQASETALATAGADLSTSNSELARKDALLLDAKKTLEAKDAELADAKKLHKTAGEQAAALAASQGIPPEKTPAGSDRIKSVKVMPRDEWNALPNQARVDFIRAGGKLSE